MTLYDRFSDRARKVMQLANQEAQRFNHEYLSPGHILLGMVKGDDGVAARIFKALKVDPRKIRLEVEKLLVPDLPAATIGRLPLTPTAKLVVQNAAAISRQEDAGADYVGTEHLLLALLSDTDHLAYRVLTSLDVTYPAVFKVLQDDDFPCPAPKPKAESQERFPYVPYVPSEVLEPVFANIIGQLYYQANATGDPQQKEQAYQALWMVMKGMDRIAMACNATHATLSISNHLTHTARLISNELGLDPMKEWGW